jgi:hypothetical protein
MLQNWGRKLTSLILAAVIWLSVNHSLTVTKTLDSVSVRLINIPAGMTIEGLEQNGILNTKVSLALQGDKHQLSEITSNDVEVVLDATGKSGEWLAPITRKNLNSVNPIIDLSRAIKRISVQQLPVSFTRLVTQKIPVFITPPAGQAPRNYQFLDVWPDHLTVTVSGPEEAVHQLKTKGINLSFNLNDICPADLESGQNREVDTIAFAVPDEWKQIVIPSLSDRPFQIDDPAAADLCIEFIRNDLHPITKPIPITLFFSPESSLALNPENLSLATSSLVGQMHGLFLLHRSLYAKGVSRLFVELVQEMLEITILLKPNGRPDWSLQFLNPRYLEDRYVSLLMADFDEFSDDPALVKKREDHLRERFRRYMSQFQLYKSKQDKLDLNIEVQGSKVVVSE